MSRKAANARYHELQAILLEPYGMERLMEMWRQLYTVPDGQSLPRGMYPIEEILKKEFPHITPADRNAVGKFLNLENWRVGIHRVPGAPEIYVDCLWWVEVQPSFDAAWVIAGFVANELQSLGPQWRKAIMIDGAAIGVVDLDNAAIEDAINSVPLLKYSRSMARDGIRYRVDTETTSATAELFFTNPDVMELVELESALLTLGDTIATASGVPELVEVMEIWWKYAGNR